MREPGHGLMAGEAAPHEQPMRQLFAPGADAILRLALWSTVLTILGGGIMTLAWSYGDFVGNVGVAPAQPVPFSHKHHSGELGLDCRNCHEQVETQATAGLPPTHTCMTCHSEIWTGSPMLAPVRDSLAKDEPLHWTRVNRLPDYVYYNHSIHIAKGIGCSSCHGAVDTMQLTYPAPSRPATLRTTPRSRSRTSRRSRPCGGASPAWPGTATPRWTARRCTTAPGARSAGRWTRAGGSTARA